MSKTYSQIAKEATDAEATAKRGRALFEESFTEWCLTAALDKRDNKVISADMAKAVAESEWSMATSEPSVALYKISGLVFSADGEAVVDNRNVVARPGGSTAVGVDTAIEWSLWTALQSLRRAGLTDMVSPAAITKAVLTGKTRQERVDAVVLLGNDRANAEQKAETEKSIREIAEAAASEEKIEKAKREVTVLSLMKSVEGALSRARDQKSKDGTVIPLGGTLAQRQAQRESLIALINSIVIEPVVEAGDEE